MNQSLIDKQKILEDGALKNIEKKFGKESFFYKKRVMPKVPVLCSTGSLSLDEALTIGGFPEGRIIEIGGMESSGKSSLCLINIGACQKKEKLCAYIDIEQTFDPSYAKKLGVDVENLIVCQPDCMEDAFEILHELIKSKVVSLIIVDSTNAMVTKSALSGEVGDAEMGKRARILSTELPKVVSECSDSGCSVIFLSQIRSKIGVMFGSPDKIGLGEAMKFMASIRIKTTKSNIGKSEEEGQDSIDIEMNIFKNKIGVPFKKAKFTLLTGLDGEYGIDTMKEVIDYAVNYDIIKKAGAWYSLGEERIGQGVSSVRKYFKDNPSTFEDIRSKIYKIIEDKREKELENLESNENSFSAKAQEIQEKVENKRKPRSKIVDNNDVSENVDQETGEVITDI